MIPVLSLERVQAGTQTLYAWWEDGAGDWLRDASGNRLEFSTARDADHYIERTYARCAKTS